MPVFKVRFVRDSVMDPVSLFMPVPEAEGPAWPPWQAQVVLLLLSLPLSGPIPDFSCPFFSEWPWVLFVCCLFSKLCRPHTHTLPKGFTAILPVGGGGERGGQGQGGWRGWGRARPWGCFPCDLAELWLEAVLAEHLESLAAPGELSAATAAGPGLGRKPGAFPEAHRAGGWRQAGEARLEGAGGPPAASEPAPAPTPFPTRAQRLPEPEAGGWTRLSPGQRSEATGREL